MFYILKKRFFKLSSFLLMSKIWSIISKINILIKMLILLIVTIKTSKSKDQIVVFVNWYKVHNTCFQHIFGDRLCLIHKYNFILHDLLYQLSHNKSKNIRLRHFFFKNERMWVRRNRHVLSGQRSFSEETVCHTAVCLREVLESRGRSDSELPHIPPPPNPLL